MTRRYALKRLGERNLDLALEKAKQYRALNQPDEAVSICRDVLDVMPDHQPALRVLGLALTDQFGAPSVVYFDEAITTFNKLATEYDRAYYSGVAWERYARAQLERGQAYNAAYGFEKALELFERAETLGPSDSPDPILRWNRCVRALGDHPQLQAALEAPHSHEFQHGD